MVLLCPYEGEDPAFRREGRLPNLLYGDQVRALWVTRFDYYSASDISRIMQQTADAGFNTVFFQVRGNATAHYPSKLEPWSEVYNFQSPNFDPLRTAVREAHSRNLAIHAWVNVMPMWRGGKPPAHKDHIYHKNPEWSWFDRTGLRQPLVSGFYVSLNPCLPEPRRHVVEVCREVVSHYDVDGLHLDYIRFPNEHPVKRGWEYPRGQATLDLFRAETGLLRPEDRPEVWDAWRCDCVTRLLADVRRVAKRTRPQIVLSAAVGAERREALARFQDLKRWWEDRLLDAVVPMNYTSCHRTFRRRVEREWRAAAARDADPFGLLAPSAEARRQKLRLKFLARAVKKAVPAAPAVGDSRSSGPPLAHTGASWTRPAEPAVITGASWARPVEPAVIMGASLDLGDSPLHQQQLQLALQRFGHFAVFAYSSLFESPNSAFVVHADPLVAAKRILRRSALLPFLRKLATPKEGNEGISQPSTSGRSAARGLPHFTHQVKPRAKWRWRGLHLRAPPPPSPSQLCASQGSAVKPQGGGEKVVGAGWRSWGPPGRSLGGRLVVAGDGDVVMLRRRTWRRSVWAEDRAHGELMERLFERRKPKHQQ